VFRNEGQKAAHVIRSYLINKVPLLVAQLAATASVVYPFDAQICVAEALSRVDTNAFPTLSSMFDDTQPNSNTLNDSVRQDFVYACCLHGLVTEASIETLLGDITYQTLPAGGRYIKENLVQQCIDDPERVQSLIKELDNMDGNVGAVCQALTEAS
jgi:mediator of RNA polymerase II transcription subunit 5